MINLFVIDDHLYTSLGLTIALDNYSDNIKVVGSSTSGKEGLELLKTMDVDIVLLDIIMPEMDGITVCKQIKDLFPKMKIIAITGELDPKILLKMWLQKPDGLLLKTCGVDELTEVIKSVLKGRRMIGDEVPSFLEYVDYEDANDTDDIPKLTKTEFKVLKLLAEGHTRQETADLLFRTLQSIDFHCRNMFIKFKTNRIKTVISEAKKARIIK
jgi:DNA-binding NarL/FixJ family response regulator